MSSGLLDIFSQTVLPAELILIDDLPANVRKFVEEDTGKNVVKEVIWRVRTSEGKYFDTITYADQAEELTAIRYWHDGHSFPENEFSDPGSQFAIKNKAVLDNLLPDSPPNRDIANLGGPKWVRA